MLFSVANGKFHKLAGDLDRPGAFNPQSTVCGLSLVPLNYFNDDEAANSYTGGRLSKYICKHCVSSKPAQKTADRTTRLLAERDRLIARNTANPNKRNETRIWNINLELAALPAN